MTNKDYLKSWHKRNPDKATEYKTRWRKNNPEKYLLLNPKGRAEKAGLSFSLTEEDIVIPSHCPVLGVKLTPVGTNSNKNQYAPSIHRIDSSKGYTKDNIIVISWRANNLLSDASYKEIKCLMQFAEKVLKDADQEDLESPETSD